MATFFCLCVCDIHVKHHQDRFAGYLSKHSRVTKVRYGQKNRRLLKFEIDLSIDYILK